MFDIDAACKAAISRVSEAVDASADRHLDEMYLKGVSMQLPKGSFTYSIEDVLNYDEIVSTLWLRLDQRCAEFAEKLHQNFLEYRHVELPELAINGKWHIIQSEKSWGFDGVTYEFILKRRTQRKNYL